MAIHKLGEDDLYNIMKNFLGGEVLSVVEKYIPAADNVKALAQNFLLYGALAEIFARSTGSTADWAARCTVSLSRSNSCPTTPSSAAPARLRWAAHFYKRSNDKSPALSLHA